MRFVAGRGAKAVKSRHRPYGRPRPLRRLRWHPIRLCRKNGIARASVRVRVQAKGIHTQALLTVRPRDPVEPMTFTYNKETRGRSVPGLATAVRRSSALCQTLSARMRAELRDANGAAQHRRALFALDSEATPGVRVGRGGVALCRTPCAPPLSVRCSPALSDPHLAAQLRIADLPTTAAVEDTLGPVPSPPILLAAQAIERRAVRRYTVRRCESVHGTGTGRGGGMRNTQHVGPSICPTIVIQGACTERAMGGEGGGESMKGREWGQMPSAVHCIQRANSF